MIRGVSYINTSANIENLDDQFVNEKAPRTGICTAQNGTLVILQVMQNNTDHVTVFFIMLV